MWNSIHPGETLPQITLRALGDADRWPELVTLNRLKHPYLVDWDAAITNPDKPTRVDYSYQEYVLRENYTYDSAPNDDRVASVQYRISTNSGSSFMTYGTVVYAYDGNGDVTGWTWST